VAGLTLDAGALIAYERGDRRIRRLLKIAFGRGVTPTIPAVVLAEVWRGTGAGAVDACIAVGVRERGDAIATSDPDDMRRLLGPTATILPV